jgi:biotin carboxyl carrier protein
MAYIVKIDQQEFRIDAIKEHNTIKIVFDNREIPVDIIAGNADTQLTFVIDNKPHTVIFYGGDQISVDGEEYAAEIVDERIQRLITASPQLGQKKEVVVSTPMPGLIIEIEAKEGDIVKAGQGLVIVEAMKMQNEMKAPQDGAVKKILVQKGQAVNSKDPLVVIE